MKYLNHEKIGYIGIRELHSKNEPMGYIINNEINCNEEGDTFFIRFIFQAPITSKRFEEIFKQYIKDEYELLFKEVL